MCPKINRREMLSTCTALAVLPALGISVPEKPKKFQQIPVDEIGGHVSNPEYEHLVLPYIFVARHEEHGRLQYKYLCNQEGFWGTSSTFKHATHFSKERAEYLLYRGIIGFACMKIDDFFARELTPEGLECILNEMLPTEISYDYVSPECEALVYPEMLQYVQKRGIETEGQLRDLIERQLPTTLAFDAESKKRWSGHWLYVERPYFYSQSGFVRNMLMVENKKVLFKGIPRCNADKL